MLVVVNGSYGQRMVSILEKTRRAHVILKYDDSEAVRAEDVIARIDADPSITHLAMIHSETTSGLINPIDFVHRLPRKVVFIVDAMSSFGAYDIPAQKWHIDFLVSSANKCLQGIPGFAFSIARKQVLDRCKDNADSLVLDLFDQETRNPIRIPHYP